MGQLGKYFGAKARARAQRKLVREQQRPQMERLDFEKKMYEDRIKKAGGMGQRAEEQLFQLTERAPEELAQARKDIIGRSTEGQQQQLAQLKLALAQQGVRGPQAARQIARATGKTAKDLTRDLNKMALQEALKRRAERTGFIRQKGATAQQAQF